MAKAPAKTAAKAAKATPKRSGEWKDRVNTKQAPGIRAGLSVDDMRSIKRQGGRVQDEIDRRLGKSSRSGNFSDRAAENQARQNWNQSEKSADNAASRAADADIRRAGLSAAAANSAANMNERQMALSASYRGGEAQRSFQNSMTAANAARGATSNKEYSAVAAAVGAPRKDIAYTNPRTGRASINQYGQHEREADTQTMKLRAQAAKGDQGAIDQLKKLQEVGLGGGAGLDPNVSAQLSSRERISAAQLAAQAAQQGNELAFRDRDRDTRIASSERMQDKDIQLKRDLPGIQAKASMESEDELRKRSAQRAVKAFNQLAKSRTVDTEIG